MFDQKASAVTNRKIAAKEATSSRRLMNMAVVPSDRLQSVTARSRQVNCIRRANFIVVRNQDLGENERVYLPWQSRSFPTRAEILSYRLLLTFGLSRRQPPDLDRTKHQP